MMASAIMTQTVRTPAPRLFTLPSPADPSSGTLTRSSLFSPCMSGFSLKTGQSLLGLVFTGVISARLPSLPEFVGNAGPVGRAPVIGSRPENLWRLSSTLSLAAYPWRLEMVRRPAKTLTHRRCRCTLSKHNTAQDYRLDVTEGLASIEWKEKSTRLDDGGRQIPATKAIPRMVSKVKEILQSMGDGEISVSAYDTAWVALVHQLDGKGGPQFPSSLDWIMSNQHIDGSWGDDLFSAHDRMINTLACVIALKSWQMCPEQCDKGLVFMRENLWRIGEEDATLMPIGFEIAFPSLMERAQDLGLELPYDDPALQDTFKRRNLKLQKIPRKTLHEVPTTLLHTLEGLCNLNWDKLLKLQCLDGSFLFSPAASATALEHTGDRKCLHYLERIVDKFNGGVPNVYPVDLFEHVWVVDRLERLGIGRYFEPNIRECMAYVHRNWTEIGICWARNSTVQDVDDTAMGFRLLRLHGYNVSTDVFRNFEKENEFVCFVGQSDQAVTGMFNLNRASQVMYPGEEILGRAKKFTYRFLREKQAAKQLTDKWIVTKDLPGEVDYGLDFPWYTSLPRIEARMYLGQYGGAGDVWIGKTFYRMLYVNNDLYLELAKLDFNLCQAVHQMELIGFKSWYEESGLTAHGVSQDSVLRAYFLSAAIIYEPERAAERLGWAQSALIAEAISSYLSSEKNSEKKWHEFVGAFLNGHTRSKHEQTRGSLVGTLEKAIDCLVSNGHHRQHFREAWQDWLQTWRMDRVETGLLLVRTIEACGGRSGSGDPASNLAYHRLSKLTSSICHRLSSQMVKVKGAGNGTTHDNALDTEMQELIRCVLQSSDVLNNQTKQTFLNVAKSYYYTAHCPAAKFERHINQVLFEPVF